MLTLNFMWNKGERIYSYKNVIYIAILRLFSGRKLNELNVKNEN